MVDISSRSCLTVILAAGDGKRMRSSLPKVLHPVAGLPMVFHVLETARSAGSNDCAVVVGSQAERVEAAVQGYSADTGIHHQSERNGTAHAVLAARAAVREDHDDVVVLYGDVPLIQAETIAAARQQLADGADIVVLGFHTDDPTGYGRLLIENGQLSAIREHRDASQEERAITFCNSGIMLFRAAIALPVLDAIGNNNSQGEYYLTDAVEVGRQRGLNVVAVDVPFEETMGVNDRVQLAEIEAIWQNNRRTELMAAGVSMAAPSTVHLHHDTEIEADVVLEPNIVFGPGVTVRSGAILRAFSHIEGADIGRDVQIGPFARLRPGTVLDTGSKIGNFVEIKSTTVGEGAKINHLSYVGNAEVGARANVGAGAITCNYDGFNKFNTVIGEGAFIGSNTALVSPVVVGDNANTGAGSTITKDVPADALAIARSRQTNLLGKAKSLRARNAETKAKKKP